MRCPSCGKENPDNVNPCPKCGTLAPPPSRTPPGEEGIRQRGTLDASSVARLGDRLIATLLDSVLGAVAFAVVGMYSAVRFGGVTERGFSLEGTPALIGIGGALILGFLYFWLLEGLFGTTLGKAIIGIRVRDRSGGTCGLKASLIRNLFRVVDGLGLYLVGFLVAILSRRRQRLGDHLAGTLVLEGEVRSIVRGVLVATWLLLIAGGGWWAYRIHADSGTSAAVPPDKEVAGESRPGPAEGVSPGVASTASPARARGELAIVHFSFLENEAGPARPEGPYKPGEKVHTRFAVAGFDTDDQRRPRLLFEVVPMDPGGLKLYENWVAEFDQPLAAPNDPVPSTYSFDIPDFAPGGRYTLRIQVTDGVKNRESSLTPTFLVEAPPAKTATELEIRGFGLARTEGGSPEPRLVLEGGGMLYMAFKVTGIQFRENRMDVNVALRILGPGGETLLEKDDLVEMQDEHFYHPPTFFKEVTSWATLPASAPKGTYTASFEVTDRLAEKTLRHDRTFEVR